MLDIAIPRFTTNAMSKAAEIDPGIVKVWLQRGSIAPDYLEPLPTRSRPMFSLITVFRARLARVLSTQLGFNPLELRKADECDKEISPEAIRRLSPLAIETPFKQKMSTNSAHRLAAMVADEGWMWAAARAAEKGKPLELYAGLNRIDDCWQYFIEVEPSNFAKQFAENEAYVVIPIGALFTNVYYRCKEMVEGGRMKKHRRRHGA